MYRIEYSKQAVRALRRMPSNMATLIRTKVAEIAQAPHAARNVKKLTARPGYRLRVGDWRVLFLLNEQRLLVVVSDIAARGEVCK